MKKVLIATSNAGKRKELIEALGDVPGVIFITLLDLETPIPDMEETGETFTENALQKAKYYAQQTGLPTLGEDSGLTLAALPDLFGVRTRRQIVAENDVEWLRIFLEMLEDATDRSARFTSAIGFYDPESGDTFVTEGATQGEIVDFPMSPLERGIPVSGVFLPDGFDDVYSGMMPHEKAACSHRGKASKPMATHLRNWASGV